MPSREKPKLHPHLMGHLPPPAFLSLSSLALPQNKLCPHHPQPEGLVPPGQHGIAKG